MLLSSAALIPVLLLGIPLPRLQHQNSNQDKSENGVARSHDLEAVVPAEDHILAVLGGSRLPALLGVPHAGADHAQAVNGVGDVHAGADGVQQQRGAVEEEVGLAGAEELEEEAEEAKGDHDAEHASDEGRRLVHKVEVGLQLVEIAGVGHLLGPEQRIVVRERGEEDAEEEADGCERGHGKHARCAGSRDEEDVRPMMRNVAKEPEPR